MSVTTQDGALLRGEPEANGIRSAAIGALLNAYKEAELELHSFMLLRHGQVVAEAGWSPHHSEQAHMLYSLSKSFTSTAVGLAVEEGKLSVDDQVVSFFPDKTIRDDARLQAMQVRHLLTMSTGHGQESLGAVSRRTEKDWVQHVLNQPLVSEPGSRFVYNSGATYMLSAIVQRVTGQTVHEYLQPRLFEPLAIRSSRWEQCPAGINTGGWGLWLRTEEIAKFGQLYLQRGNWQGRRVVPEAWIEQATGRQIATSSTNPDWSQGYGYQFWQCLHGAYRADGAFGQFCVVWPEHDIVLAITAGTRLAQEVLGHVWDHLLPGIAQDPLQADPGGREELQRTIESLAYAPVPAGVLPNEAVRAAGRRYKFADPVRGLLHTAAWEWNGDGGEFSAESEVGDIQVRFGMGSWVEGRTRIGPDELLVAASGGWSAPDTLMLVFRSVETPHVDTLICRFEGDEVRLRWESTARFGDEASQEFIGTRY